MDPWQYNSQRAEHDRQLGITQFIHQREQNSAQRAALARSIKDTKTIIELDWTT